MAASSIAGKEGNATASGYSASGYSASKAGVIAFTKSLGKETALNNIAVNCITSAAAKTRIFDQVTREHIDFMLPKGSFYHHFGSKEGFAAAALERYGMRERDHATTFLNDTTISPLKRLRRYFNDMVKIYGQKGTIPGCMMGRNCLREDRRNRLLPVVERSADLSP
jgi:NAD(P)-dependent dehydrogenase (short-subunit alcohol dehydrogenase family)